MELDLHNRKQWVLVPVLDQCEHFYMVLYFLFGFCTGPGSVQCISLDFSLQDSGNLSADDFSNPQSTPVIRTADVQRGLDLFAPWLQSDNRQPFLLVGPEGCGKG